MIVFLNLLETSEERDWVEDLYQQYKGLIKYVAMQKLKDEPLAEDAVQEVMLAVIRNVKKLQACEADAIKGFLYLVTRNVAVDLLRKESRRSAERLEDLPLQAPLNSDPQHRLGEQALWDCIDSMPPAYRDVLELTVYYGFTPAEIAKLLKLSPVAVRKRLERARKSVRSTLKGEVEYV